MTTPKRTTILLALLGALALAGCGGEDDEGSPIPADTAAALQRQLDNVEGRLDNGSAGACRDILEGPRDPNLPAVQGLIDGLSEDVRDRDALQQSFENLWDLVERECEQREQQEEEAQPDPLPVPDDTNTDTVPEDTDTEEEPPPPEEDEGDGEETLPPGQDGELPPGQDGETPGQGGGGGGVAPGEEGNE